MSETFNFIKKTYEQTMSNYNYYITNKQKNDANVTLDSLRRGIIGLQVGLTDSAEKQQVQQMLADVENKQKQLHVMFPEVDYQQVLNQMSETLKSLMKTGSTDYYRELYYKTLINNVEQLLDFYNAGGVRGPSSYKLYGGERRKRTRTRTKTNKRGSKKSSSRKSRKSRRSRKNSRDVY